MSSASLCASARGVDCGATPYKIKQRTPRQPFRRLRVVIAPGDVHCPKSPPRFSSLEAQLIHNAELSMRDRGGSGSQGVEGGGNAGRWRASDRGRVRGTASARVKGSCGAVKPRAWLCTTRVQARADDTPPQRRSNDSRTFYLSQYHPITVPRTSLARGPFDIPTFASALGDV